MFQLKVHVHRWCRWFQFEADERGKKFWKSVKDLDDNLKVLLFQLPPSFKYNKINMERLESMTYIPKKNNSGKVVIEYKDLEQFDLISDLLTKN